MITAKTTNYINKKSARDLKDHPKLVCTGNGTVLLTIPKLKHHKLYDDYCFWEVDAIVLISNHCDWKVGSVIYKLNLECCYIYDDEIAIRNIK